MKTPTPSPSTDHANTPWLWLQEYETTAGPDDCACHLDRAGLAGVPGAAFYPCAQHAAAPELVAVLRAILPVCIGSWGDSDHKLIKQGRAALARAEGRTP